MSIADLQGRVGHPTSDVHADLASQLGASVRHPFCDNLEDGFHQPQHLPFLDVVRIGCVVEFDAECGVGCTRNPLWGSSMLVWLPE